MENTGGTRVKFNENYECACSFTRRSLGFYDTSIRMRGCVENLVNWFCHCGMVRKLFTFLIYDYRKLDEQ